MQAVFIDTKAITLKPNLLEFLTKMIDMAKDTKDYILSVKKNDLAEETGQSIRTVTRYLNKLEEDEIIHTRSRKGRNGGTVILFNSDSIKFETSDKALVNTDKETIDKVLEDKYPKKPEQDPNKKKRNRRTKQQMLEDKLVRSEKQKYIDNLNDELEKIGGYPDWDWFQKTDDPIKNYKIFILSRMYNRYAKLFTDLHNAEVQVMETGKKVKPVTKDYDVLPYRFYGSVIWNNFASLNSFLEDNDIQPLPYLTAMFDRSLFIAGTQGSSNPLPYTNTLYGEKSYEIYKDYDGYNQKRFNSGMSLFNQYVIPHKFTSDFVIKSLDESYTYPDLSSGFLELRAPINSFLKGESEKEIEKKLAQFYRVTDKALKIDKVSHKTRDTIKKFLILQSLLQSDGDNKTPIDIVMGSELVQALLLYIDGEKLQNPEIDVDYKKERALGLLIYPNLSEEEQIEKGAELMYKYRALDETPRLMKLMMHQRGLYLGFNDIREALKEYGADKIPVDEYSILDTDQVVKFIDKEFPVEEEQYVTDVSIDDIVDMANHNNSIENPFNGEGAITSKSDLDKELENYFGKDDE